MEVNAEVKRGKERQRNSPVDCFDISPKVHSTCDKIHPLPPRRHKLYIACGDFFISFFKIATSLIPLLLLFPKKLTLFGDPEFLQTINFLQIVGILDRFFKFAVIVHISRNAGIHSLRVACDDFRI